MTRLAAGLRDLLEQSTSRSASPRRRRFLEMGLDSLTLTQVAQQIQRAFNVKITFRQIMESLSNVDSWRDSWMSRCPLDAPVPDACHRRRLTRGPAAAAGCSCPSPRRPPPARPARSSTSSSG